MIAELLLSIPNVLFIVMDDISQRDPVPRPTLDLLASQGVQYDRLYSAPWCSPSRWSALRGEDRVRVAPVCGTWSPRGWLPAGADSIVTDQPWSNAVLVGKWHLGRHLDENVGWEFSPQLTLGFDDWRAGVSSNVGSPGACGTAGDYLDWDRVESGVVFRSSRYNTTEIRDAVLEEVAKPGPWFVMASFQAAHSPFHIPPGEPFIIGATARQKYESMISHLDKIIGELVAAVDLSNTIVLIVGDNGTPQFAPFGGLPRERLKGSVYEDGIRVPGIWLGVGATAGTVIDDVVSFSDLRRMLQACDPIPAPGRIAFAGNDQLGGQVRLGVVNKRWKYMEIDGVPELYDLSIDPMENTNLSGVMGYELVESELRAELRRRDPRPDR